MNVSGEFTVKAPRQAVFDTIRDPKTFIALVDGIQDLKEIDPTHYTAVFETKIAYLKFRFNVSVEVTKLEVGEIGAKIEGTPLGVVGRLTALSTTTLTEAGDETKVAYSVEATLAGKLGSMGQPVLRSKAKDMEKVFASRLREKFAQAEAEQKS
jgi:carbon monoxide dehydrogenase subunit G